MTSRLRITAPGTPPAAGFEQPFEMLHACHERVARMLALLRRLREHLRSSGADEQARQAARDVMRYFDVAAPEHHRDEELHVFPPLLASGDPVVSGVVERLKRDHVDMASGWAAVRALLDDIAQGRCAAFDPAQEHVLEAFERLYADHLRAEDDIAYPRARALIDAERLEAMSRDMMRRRGVAPSHRG